MTEYRTGNLNDARDGLYTYEDTDFPPPRHENYGEVRPMFELIPTTMNPEVARDHRPDRCAMCSPDFHPQWHLPLQDKSEMHRPHP